MTRPLTPCLAIVNTNPAETKALLRKRLTTVDDVAFELAYKDLGQLVPKSPAVGPIEEAGIRDFVTTVNPKANVTFEGFFNTQISKMADVGAHSMISSSQCTQLAPRRSHSYNNYVISALIVNPWTIKLLFVSFIY